MSKRKATLVVDLGFGDAGKGTIVDHLVRSESALTVVRFNGGGQAAHNVITGYGRHHTFSQFGSGTFVPKVRTHLSSHVLLDPLTLQFEADHLGEIGCGNVFARFSVDERALVVTPFHKSANRIREALRGNERHGSCGMGIGETTFDNIISPHLSIRASDLRDQKRLAELLKGIQEWKRVEFFSHFSETFRNLPHVAQEVARLEDTDAPEEYAYAMWKTAQQFPIVGSSYLRRLALEGNLVFEGAQGVLLDEWYGFHPYTTWSTTTFSNALQVLKEIEFDGDVVRLGVTRAYQTRHGAGPFPTEDENLSALIPDMHNGTGQWQGAFRLGWLDMVLMRYAVDVCGGVDSLAVTNLDRFKSVGNRKMCVEYIHHEGGRTATLPVKENLTDLAFQEALRHILEEVTPCYEEAPNNDTLYLRMIENNLEVPISLISYGPTTDDKQKFV